ncbi:DUF2868 domain-containing protein [Desulfotalea psychrophila]|uniref:DUF2868 domain-containing protein n=1 Tax=Desulfotalea psychrophila (strain LSv54 / DSM 12343) TaxID=177439 RepID=Q6AJ97_DESPS|nr:DUF2868 domain-containing protein [Desulfotalea psychrophila]CAG37583.1 unknown protein [Desulfotalea psychrophila LSv54]
MNPKYRDIIDAAFFFHLDRQKNWQELHKRDRALFLEYVPKDGQEDSARLLSIWLAAQRGKQCIDTESIGTIVSKALSRIHLILLVISFFVGISATTTFLYYSGTTPINIFSFIIIFIGSQLCTITLALLVRLIRSLGQGQKSLSPPLIRYCLALFTSFLAGPLIAKFPAEKRLNYEHALGILKQNKGYSVDLSSLFNRIHQSASISLNIGLLFGALYKIITSDIAFGWQSTLRLSTEYIQTMVQIVSAPWNWSSLLAHANPTLEQIAGSRIILKDGIYHLANQNLSSWWPFLILCLLTYGLLPRILLFLIALLQERKSLQSSTTRRAEYQKLFHRMRTPIYEQKSEKEPGQTIGADATDKDRRFSHTGDEQSQTGHQATVTVLIAADIRNARHDNILKTLLLQHGYRAERLITFMADYASDQEIVDQLALQNSKQHCPIFIVMEANMVPLTEFLSYVQTIREKTQTTVEVLLVNSLADGSLVSPKETETLLWQQKIAGLGDSFIQLFPITLGEIQ